MTGFIWIKNTKRSTYDLELDEFGWYKYIMFHRRRSIFCRVWLNSKTFTHAALLTHANHATHAKTWTHGTHAKILWTHATNVTHAKILWTNATHAKIWPTLSTLPTNPRHPRDLADSRLSSKFTKIKGKTIKEHQYDIVHYVICPEGQCSENFAGETARRLSERVLEHNGRGAKSHLVKDAIKKCHKYPKIEDFNVM